MILMQNDSFTVEINQLLDGGFALAMRDAAKEQLLSSPSLISLESDIERSDIAFTLRQARSGPDIPSSENEQAQLLGQQGYKVISRREPEEDDPGPYDVY